MPPEVTHRHRPPSSACPSPIDLASWCDGTPEAMHSGAIALHLAECADCRAILSSLSGDLETVTASESPALLARIVERASALVETPAALPMQSDEARRSVVAPATPWWSACAAAASIAAALIGWQAASILVAPDTGAERAWGSAHSVADAGRWRSDVVARAPDAANFGAAMPSNSADAPNGATAQDEAELLVTFGLIEDFGGTEILGSGVERSES